MQMNEYREQAPRLRSSKRLYHLGNNVHHMYVFKELCQNPGAVVLHDVCQHHMITEYTLARGDRQGYRDFLVEEMGDYGLRVADNREKGIWSDLYNFLIPLNQPALNAASSVIVHSEWARVQVLPKVGGKPVCVIPHHHPDSVDPQEDDRERARERLNIPQQQLVFVSLGFVTPPKQVDLTLRALSGIASELGDFGFCIVGEAHDKRALTKDIKAAGLEENTRLTGYVSLEEMEDYIKAADIIVNLRYPTAGESSGTLARAMGEGRCAVVFDYASFADYPDDTLCKLPLETSNSEPLANALLELARDPDKRGELGGNARRHIEENHKIDDCVERYVQFLVTREVINYA